MGLGIKQQVYNPLLRSAITSLLKRSFTTHSQLFNNQEDQHLKELQNNTKARVNFKDLKAVDKDISEDLQETGSILNSNKSLILKDNVYTLPNFLTMTRIISAPFVGYYIYTGQSHLAMSLFTYSCVTDFLDGFIARTFNMKSILGTVLDPIADKLLMGISTIALMLGNIMPLYVAAIIIGKDFMLALMGVYYRYVTLPAPKTFHRLINLSIPTVRVEPNLLSKVNTGLQMLYIVGLVFKTQLEPMITNYDFLLGNYEVVVSFTTVLSGLSYLLSSKSIKRIL